MLLGDQATLQTGVQREAQIEAAEEEMVVRERIEEAAKEIISEEINDQSSYSTSSKGFSCNKDS